MRRLLGTLLAACLLGITTGPPVGAQSPSPAAATPDTPGDLAQLLPSQIGGSELIVEADMEDPWLPFFGDDEFASFDGLLVGSGVDPSDLQTAWAYTPDGTPPPWYSVFIMRVDGVPASLLHDMYLRSLAHTSDDQTFPPLTVAPARTIGDRVVWTRQSDEDTSWLFFYPKGEALFGVSGHAGVTLAEALAQLP